MVCKQTPCIYDTAQFVEFSTVTVGDKKLKLPSRLLVGFFFFFEGGGGGVVFFFFLLFAFNPHVV